MNDEKKRSYLLRDLPTELKPPDHLEASTLKALNRAHLLRKSPARLRLVSWAAIFIGGFALGWVVSLAPQSTNSAEKYLMLLMEDESFTYHGQTQAEVVQEYASWAKDRRENVLMGEELDMSVWSSVSNLESKNRVTGFFLIEAKNEKAAIDVAQSCPHLNHGGQIDLHPINSH